MADSTPRKGRSHSQRSLPYGAETRCFVFGHVPLWASLLRSPERTDCWVSQVRPQGRGVGLDSQNYLD